MPSANEFIRRERGQSSNYNDPAPPPSTQSWQHFSASAERDQNERDALSFERYLAQLAKQQDMIYDALIKGKA